MTMQVPDELAKRIQPMSAWLPTIIELGLIGLKTAATATAAEVVEFLSKNPSRREVLEYHASDEAQARLRRLLSLNEAGLLSETEERELDELQRIDHIITMLKARTSRAA